MLVIPEFPQLIMLLIATVTSTASVILTKKSNVKINVTLNYSPNFLYVHLEKAVTKNIVPYIYIY